jgi:hypothetical protein
MGRIRLSFAKQNGPLHGLYCSWEYRSGHELTPFFPETPVLSLLFAQNPRLIRYRLVFAFFRLPSFSCQKSGPFVSKARASRQYAGMGDCQPFPHAFTGAPATGCVFRRRARLPLARYIAVPCHYKTVQKISLPYGRINPFLQGGQPPCIPPLKG